jgi:hypothetical protein
MEHNTSVHETPDEAPSGGRMSHMGLSKVFLTLSLGDRPTTMDRAPCRELWTTYSFSPATDREGIQESGEKRATVSLSNRENTDALP